MKLFNKWEQILWSYPMVAYNIDIFYNVKTTREVYVDVYRKKKWNGVYKYKRKIISCGEILLREQLTF